MIKKEKIIISIYPKYTKKIFSGEKNYEFRKVIPIEPIDTILIYETTPTKAIVGEFTVGKIFTHCPGEVWLHCKGKAGISKKEFDKYFNGSHTAYAIEIINPIKYESLVYNQDPIQNFKYIKDHELNFIRRESDSFKEFTVSRKIEKVYGYEFQTVLGINEADALKRHFNKEGSSFCQKIDVISYGYPEVKEQ